MDTTDHDPTATGGGEGTAESSPDGAAEASPHAYDYPAPGGAGTSAGRSFRLSGKAMGRAS